MKPICKKFALACLTEPRTGKLVTAQNKMGALKWHLLRELVEKKEKWGIAGTIDKTDIVGLVTYGWERSFVRVESNQGCGRVRMGST
jgi:hypothetical protein